MACTIEGREGESPRRERGTGGGAIVIGAVLPPLLLYAVGLPVLAVHLDRVHGTQLNVPASARWVGTAISAVGAVVALWSAVCLVRYGRGTPNPRRPPVELVERGPYRWSRNPLMLGGWVFGGGLAVTLGSPALLMACLAVACAGLLYVRRVEEPRLESRFGASWRRYAARVPRWLAVVVAAAIVAGPVSGQAPSELAVPSVVVRIDVVPGGAQRWVELFEKWMVPAIREAIELGDELVGFEYFEGVVASETTDVILVLRARSFAFFDGRRMPPHYRALFRRLGAEEASRVVAEMTALERSVEVTLTRSFGSSEGPD